MKRHTMTRIVWGGAVVIALAVGIPLFGVVSDSWYRGKIVPGVRLGSRDVGGFSIEYARDMIRAYDDRLNAKGISLVFKDKKATIYPHPVALTSDIPLEATVPLVDINTDKTVAELSSVGRSGSIFQQQLDRTRVAMFKTSLVPSFTIQRDQFIEQLRKEYSFFHTPARNASFILDKTGTLVIQEEKRGIEFDYDDALTALDAQLSTLTDPVIELSEGSTQPTIRTSDLESLLPRAKELVDTPFTLEFENTPPESGKEEKHQWELSSQVRASWLTAKRNADANVEITLDIEAIRSYLAKHIAPDIRVEVRHPRFEMRDGKVVAFEVSKNGRELDGEETARRIIVALESREPSTVAMVKEVVSPFTNGDASGVNIKELVARGETSFAGSPTNRRKNIARGAALLNGILLAPGEEFSTIKALGAIDDTNGFLPELVIKGTKTTPEFGGGLCQVSTTLFRAASFAGLAILERRNHSYRVSYYEPPVGFDATIYDPAPDFKFKNDTSFYLLIQTSTAGNKMIVELWGTKDGRSVEIDKPTVYNVRVAGETKIVETDELPPGEKKCTERAHNGADAFFERRIFYADGTTNKETYKSHYVVWPAVCLVGVKKEDAQPDQEASAQTDTNSPPETEKQTTPE